MSWQLGLAMVCILIGVPLLAVYATQASFWSERAKLAEWELALGGREAALTVRERQAWDREVELGRRAHDIHTMLNMRATAILDDTTIVQVLDWSELP